MMGMKMDFADEKSEEAPKEEAPKKEATPEPEPEPEPELTAEELAEREAARARAAKALALKEEGNALYKAKDFDAAIVKYRAAQEVEPSAAAYVLNESAALFMQQKW